MVDLREGEDARPRVVDVGRDEAGRGSLQVEQWVQPTGKSAGWGSRWGGKGNCGGGGGGLGGLEGGAGLPVLGAGVGGLGEAGRGVVARVADPLVVSHTLQAEAFLQQQQV